MTEELDKYVREHTSTEGDYLYRLYRATNIHTIHGRMASGHLQGRLLKMLVEMVQPQNVLEVGTFSGYSALCLAEGLPEGAHLYTFEINDEMEDFTRPWIEGSPYADKISFIIGDANEKAPELGVTFDMAFVDGDKRTYVETYDPADSYSPTTRSGTDTSPTQPTTTTSRRLAYADSTTMWLPTNAWSSSYCQCATD